MNLNIQKNENNYTREKLALMFNTINGFKSNASTGYIHIKKYPEDIPQIIAEYQIWIDKGLIKE